ncbi:duf803 domain membrane protein [Moniliophthora roreri MCA 2997]|uniref:Duf803 domain membrane protein n=2 Tax=Moniliophthora roreri TaxID=221103 RepID=V2XXF8_MONRO|nr:duf803 domain membrane protein [Moniliophthora roreri MCA 2997]
MFILPDSSFLMAETLRGGEVLPELTTATVIGITVAIAGNVLISLALNIQKLAHQRLDAQKPSHSETSLRGRRGSTLQEEEENEDERTHDENSNHISQPQPSSSSSTSQPESQPLLPFPRVESADYGTAPNSENDSHKHKARSWLSRLILPSCHDKPRPVLAMPVEVITEESFQNQNGWDNRNGSKKPEHNSKQDVDNGNESDYLKSKLWWSGFLLMNLGEMGNFISYAWAPASIVAPLGTFALIANCFFAPLIIGERFRKRDILGILIAIVGAVTVVLSSNASDGRLDPDGLVRAISQIPFIVYACIYAVAATILAVLSQGPLGRQWVLVDVGLCALFGGFTVLSTKAVSTLLTMRWSQVFNRFITYPVILVLVLTGVGQIRYLNRALMRFDSKIVIPIQFVLFNLSAIIGSAILYGDFRRATFHQVVTFLYGCGATFLGVFIICWTSTITNKDNDGDTAEDEGYSNDRSVRTPRDSDTQLGTGALGRRRRATLVLPTGVKDHQVLRHRHSAVSVMGLSPAQPLLLVHTPPREIPLRDVERGVDAARSLSTPDSISRRRALNWLGEEPRQALNHDNERTTRDSSLMSRGTTRTGAPGSLGDGSRS